MEGTTVNKIHIFLGDLSVLSDPLTVPDLIPSGLLSPLSPYYSIVSIFVGGIGSSGLRKSQVTFGH